MIFGHFLKLKKKKKIDKKQEHNERLIKDRIIRDIGSLFEQQEDYYEHKRESNFGNYSYIENESNGDKNRNLHCAKSAQIQNFFWSIF